MQQISFIYKLNIINYWGYNAKYPLTYLAIHSTADCTWRLEQLTEFSLCINKTWYKTDIYPWWPKITALTVKTESSLSQLNILKDQYLISIINKYNSRFDI